MEQFYCLTVEKIQSKSSKVVKSKKWRKMLSSKCGVCDSKQFRFIKEQEGNGLLSGLLTKIPTLS